MGVTGVPVAWVTRLGAGAITRSPARLVTTVPETMVVGLLAENVTVEGVLQLYPQLTAQDVRACRAYAAAHDRR